MKLTGKCKEDFEKWYLNRYFPNVEAIGISQAISIIDKGAIGLRRFYYLPKEMQWGVYVDFFDSVGCGIAARKESNEYIWFVGKTERDFYINKKESLNEAREAAIIKANEIYNNI